VARYWRRGTAHFEALPELVDVLSATTPVVLTLEDLHWANTSTRAFLRFLSVNLCQERVLVVCSYRPDDLHRRHPLRHLLAELERDTRATRITLEPLTDRERQVLELVAGGATNREIGATLFMAEKTASVHVSRILAELDVRSRTEAAAVAHRLGLAGESPSVAT
jgi:DNA-binding CsgD family transcriptional regulator